MMTTHPLIPGDMTFEQEIARHSGDKTVSYKAAPDRDLLISFFHPDGYAPEKQKYPLFVFVHGGGWQGRKLFPDQADWAGDYLGFLARYYADHGFLCASIDYRLMREGGQQSGYQLTDLTADCMDAVEHLRSHADELGVDGERTVVLGESAGGHLAGVLSTQSDFFRAAVLVNPITDLMDMKWGKYLPANAAPAESLSRRLSPLAHVRPDTCPTLLLHGAEDSVVSPQHSISFHEKMLECGNRADLHLIENTNHAFLLAEYMQEGGKPLDAARIAVRVIDEWLADTLI